MIITQTITKKTLETIVQKTFLNFGSLYCSSLLDSLKLLGFYYATNAGISINIEDLKTPDAKKDFLKIANQEINFVSEQWQQGYVSDNERFQTIIDSWNIATESLKNRIIEYYQNFDPANNLYIMAFSGARGNMSQVRQLVGMRGLMSDQEGKIIDLPIQANFREGLSSIDYIISSYGARKGIVDTALKTADSGYLTRRLIYSAQDLVIREKDCFTKSGVIVVITKKTNTNNLLGRSMITAKSLKFPYDFISPAEISSSDSFLTIEKLTHLKKYFPLTINVRSSLTCKSKGSICQTCYGWDLSSNKEISLGEAVGIIAAQSIGEPGTQLTMRTFHTGGIFTSESLKQVVAPFSGKILIPKSLKSIIYRTNHGVKVLKLQQETFLTIINWKGIKEDIFLDIGSFLYLKFSCFIKKGQVIAEYSTQSILPGARRLKPIYTKIAGEIKFENLILLKTYQRKRLLKITKDNGLIWIASGKIFSVPRDVKFTFPKNLQKKKAFAVLKIVSPYEGIFSKTEKSISIATNKNKIEFDFSSFSKSFPNHSVEIIFSTKNYQYIDKYTVIGKINFYSIFEGKIYSIRKKPKRKKHSKRNITFFLIIENDIWKMNSDQVTNYSVFRKRKRVIRSGTSLNTVVKSSKSGFFFKKDGFQMIFQNTSPIFLSLGTILNYKKGDFVLEKQLFANLLTYTQQTEDIVQGLPKIEELIEARQPLTNLTATLSRKPGIVLKSSSILSSFEIKDDIISIQREKSEFVNAYKFYKGKTYVPILHRIALKEKLFIYNNKPVKISLIPKRFVPKKEKKNEYRFVANYHKFTGKNYKLSTILKRKKKRQTKQQVLKIRGRNAIWMLSTRKIINNNLYSYEKNKLTKIETFSSSLLFCKAKTLPNYWICQSTKNQFFLVRFLCPIWRYNLSLSQKIIVKPGNFVDIGEPLTEGIIDIHDLLSILFRYHSTIDGTMLGTLRSLNKFQLLLVNSVQAIYESQNVTISSKHIEIIIRQMTSKVVIKRSGDTPFLPGEVVRLSMISQLYKAFKGDPNISAIGIDRKKQKSYRTPKYEPLLLSTTNSSLRKDGFLSAAGFQETKKILTKAAIEGSSDWLRALKECVIVGRLIPAGSSFLNYKNYLDNIFLYKTKIV